MSKRYFSRLAIFAWGSGIPLIYFGFGSVFLNHWLALTLVLAFAEFFYHYIR